MKITVSGERCEGKTTLILHLANWLANGHGCAVIVKSQVPLGCSIQKYLKEVSLGQKEIIIVEENSSEDVWDGKIVAKNLGVIHGI